MAVNPYDPNELKRAAQIDALKGGDVSSTMPIGSGQRLQREPVSAGRTSVAPQPGRPPAGWDATNWADPSMQSVKYQAGRLLNGLTKPSEVGALVSGQNFQTVFPGATFDGKDRINFQGALADGDHGDPVFDVDVLGAADRDADTSSGLWWGDQAHMGETAAAPAAAQPQVGLNPALDNSAMARIMAELSAASEDRQSPAQRDAILELLGGAM